MKSIKFPTPYSVLMIVIIASAILTYFLPSGKYNTLEYNDLQKEFIIKSNNNRKRYKYRYKKF